MHAFWLDDQSIVAQRCPPRYPVRRMSFWLTISAKPKLRGPVSVGTVAAIGVLRQELNLSLAEAKRAIDKPVFDGAASRTLVPSEKLAHFVARRVSESAPGILFASVAPQTRVDDLVLVIPSKPDDERDAVAAAWELAGGSVIRLDRFWDPPPIPRDLARPYGPDTFALVLAEKLELDLSEPDPYAVVKCPPQLLGRAVSVARLGNAEQLAYPCFLKSIIPKQFRAGVYENHEALAAETQGIEADAEVLRSEVVNILAEARSFVLNGVIKSCALYEGAGDLNHAAKTSEQVAQALELPPASVIDVGLLDNGAWVLNAPWGAGLNGCDPHDVLGCIAAAARPRPAGNG